jgi:hypothetical protein
MNYNPHTGTLTRHNCTQLRDMCSQVMSLLRVVAMSRLRVPRGSIPVMWGNS